MGGFGQIMKNMLTQPIPGTEMWATKKRAEQGQQQLDIEKQQEFRRQQQADQEFAEHMQSLGAKHSLSGVVKDDQTVPEIPGIIGGGTSFQTVRPVDKGRVIRHKTAEGDTVEFELPTMEEQIRRQLMANAPTREAQTQQAGDVARASATGTAAGQTQGRVADLNARGVALPDDLAAKYGLPKGMKMLPEQLDQLVGKVVPAQVRADTSITTTGMRTGSNELIAAANRAQRDQLAADKLKFEKEKNDRDLAMKDAVSARSAAIQAGENPSLAPIKLRQFTDSVSKVQALHSELDDRQQRIFAAQDLLDPETTPDGTKFKDPYTGAPKVMNQDIRSGLEQVTAGQKKLNEIMGGVAKGQMQQLGITPKPAATPKSGAAPAASAPAGGGSGAAPPTTGTKLSPALESQAQAIANYDQEPYTGRAATRGAPVRIMARAREIYEAAHPGEKFDNTQFLLKKDAVKDFSSGGKSGQQALALNTLVRHTDDLLDLIPQLGNGSFNPANAGYQKLKSMLGSETPTNFDQLKQYLAGETVKLIRGGGGAESDVEAARENISKARSPEQLQGAMETNFKVAGGKMQALNEAAKRQHLGDDYNVLDPGARDIMTKRGYDPKTLKKMTKGGDLPKGNGAVIDKATAQKFYEAADRDPKKAQQLAETNGWKVQ